MLKGKPVELPPISTKLDIIFPILVTANWCPFTLTAERLWMEAARSVGLPLKVVDAENEDGAKLMVASNVGGVPCLVAAPNKLFYGLQISLPEAKSFLQLYHNLKGKQ